MVENEEAVFSNWSGLMALIKETQTQVQTAVMQDAE